MSAPALVARPLLGVGLIVLAGAAFASLDTLLRYTGPLVPIVLLLTSRYLFQAVMMTVWIALGPALHFRPAHPRFQFVRGLLLLGSSAASFVGLQYLPVPEFTAIAMLTPVLVTLLAAWLLKERVSRLRWSLVAGAFAGALLVIRPGTGALGWPVVFPLAGSVCYAAFQVLTSRLAALEHPLTTHFWTGAVGFALMAPLVAASGLPLGTLLPSFDIATWGLILAIGALGSVGHLILIFALGQAPTSTLMPFLYAQIGWAALLSWLVWRHLPDGWAWAGMGVITLCGAATAWLNLRRAPAHSTVELDTMAD